MKQHRTLPILLTKLRAAGRRVSLVAGSLLLPVAIMAGTSLTAGANTPPVSNDAILNSSSCATEPNTIGSEVAVNCVGATTAKTPAVTEPSKTDVHKDVPKQEVSKAAPEAPAEAPAETPAETPVEPVSSVTELPPANVPAKAETPPANVPAKAETPVKASVLSGAPPRLTVVKHTNPTSSQSFSFTSDNSQIGNFSVPGNDGSKVFENLNEATVRITETVASGWEFTSVACTGAHNWTQIDSTPAVSVELQTNENITCTFTNAKKVVPPPPTTKIIGFKFNDINGDGSFDDSEFKLPGWTMTLFQKDGDNKFVKVTSMVTDAAGNFMFDNLPVGDFKVCETLQAGWINTLPGDGTLCRSGTTSPDMVLELNFGNMKKVVPPPTPPTPPTPTPTPTPPAPPAQVLSVTTMKSNELVNTGVGASANVIVGGVIVGMIVALHFLLPRRARATQTTNTAPIHGYSPKALVMRTQRMVDQTTHQANQFLRRAKRMFTRSREEAKQKPAKSQIDA